MARPARIEYEGAFYHVMNRGKRRENIFLEDNDRQKFYEKEWTWGQIFILDNWGIKMILGDVKI